MKHILPILGFSVVVFSACGPSKKVASKNVELDTVKVSARNNPLDIYRATTPVIWDITNTRVALSFNWKDKTADGEEWISLHPYAYDQDSIVLDAKDMKVDLVAIVSGDMKHPIPFTHNNDKLKLKLDKKYRPADMLQLYITYKAMPYEEAGQGGSAAITDDRGLYFINTDYKIPGKPAHIWTQGETEANSHWMVTLDKPNQRSQFQIELTVPDSFQTLSNGALTKYVRNGNMRTDYWKMDERIQVYAAMFAIGKFTVVEDKYKGKPVNYYVEPEYGPYARLIFQHTPEMMDYFSKVTGVEYPWNKYSQVVVRDYVSGAMENTSASLFGEFVNQDAREIADRNYEDVVSHELFHQWFGDYATAESWSNVTVNESFANYGEQLWRRHYYGNDLADELSLDDLNKYLNSSKYKDPSLVRFYYRDKEEVFDRISYEKGGAILKYMHSLMGDTIFSKAMQLYLTKNALQSAEAQDWRLAVEKASGQDWNWFFNQWYYRAGHPSLDVTYDYNDAQKQLVVTVAQTQKDKPYILPLKAAIITGTDKKIVDWNLKNKEEVFIYPYINGAKPVVITDATHVLPGEIVEHKTPSQWLATYRSADDYITKHHAILNTYKVDDTASMAIIDLALNDKISSIRRYALNVLSVTKSGKWQDRFRSQVQYLAVNDGNNRVRAAAFTVLNVWMVTGSKQEMQTAVWDSSYAVSGAALRGLRTLDTNAAYTMAKEVLKTKPRAELRSAAWEVIGERGDAADISLFEAEAPYCYGAKKFDLAGALSVYLLNVKDDGAFQRGLNLLAQLGTSESIKGFRMALFNEVFELEDAYKVQKTAKAKERVEIIKKKESEILASERDPENIKELQKLLKD